MNLPSFLKPFAARRPTTNPVVAHETPIGDHQAAARTLALRGAAKRKAEAEALRRKINRELCECAGTPVPECWRDA